MLNKIDIMRKISSLFLVLVYITPNLDPRKSVSFIDIYGDSTLIIDSFNQCNILIDTGEHDDYDSVINYLKRTAIYYLNINLK